MSVPQRINSFLKQKKLSQRDFCNITGYSPSNFSNFLIGRTTNPRIDLIDAFTSHFPDLSVNWLFTGKGSMWLNEDDQKRVGDEKIPEKEPLKDELLSMYKRRVADLEREIKSHCSDLAHRLEL